MIDLTVNEHSQIKNAITKSQHCQRNWDLSKKIPKEDMDLLIHAATECPSKQNVAFYKAHFITNRDIINKIHNASDGFSIDFNTTNTVTNSQTLANLLIVFEMVNYMDSINVDSWYAGGRNDQTARIKNNQELTKGEKWCLERDTNMAIGIAAGYVNVTATLLGYSTGCCACFDDKLVSSILNTKGKPMLVMGVGYKDPNRNRRIHHNSDFVFPSIKKQKIEVNILN